jgi:hypothetical protein
MSSPRVRTLDDEFSMVLREDDDGTDDPLRQLEDWGEV